MRVGVCGFVCVSVSGCQPCRVGLYMAVCPSDCGRLTHGVLGVTASVGVVSLLCLAPTKAGLIVYEGPLGVATRVACCTGDQELGGLQWPLQRHQSRLVDKDAGFPGSARVLYYPRGERLCVGVRTCGL